MKMLREQILHIMKDFLQLAQSSKRAGNNELLKNANKAATQCEQVLNTNNAYATINKQPTKYLFAEDLWDLTSCPVNENGLEYGLDFETEEIGIVFFHKTITTFEGFKEVVQEGLYKIAIRDAKHVQGNECTCKYGNFKFNVNTNRIESYHFDIEGEIFEYNSQDDDRVITLDTLSEWYYF